MHMQKFAFIINQAAFEKKERLVYIIIRLNIFDSKLKIIEYWCH